MAPTRRRDDRPVFVFQHVPHETPGHFAGALRRAGARLRTVDVWKPSARWPHPSDARGLLVMGGPMGVYEKGRYPFLRKELRTIRRFIAAGKPLLGVCLGAQLVAHALGARVHRNPRGSEIGWYRVALTAAGRRDPVLGAWPARPWVFQWHGDTFDLPRGATLLARAPRCRRQAFRWGRRVYGLQFHPEVTAAMVRAWLREPGSSEEIARVGPGAEAALRRGLRSLEPVMARQARPVLARFARLLAGRRLAPADPF